MSLVSSTQSAVKAIARGKIIENPKIVAEPYNFRLMQTELRDVIAPQEIEGKGLTVSL